jgi:hypothetical protein
MNWLPTIRMKTATIVLAWYYVVAPATTVQQPDGRIVSWPPILEGPYIEETDCQQRAERVRQQGRSAHCEASQVLRELRR